MNLENYKLTLNEFLIMLRNVCSYENDLNYESISDSIKKQVYDYFVHESLQVHEFITCVHSTMKDFDIFDDDKELFFDCLFQRLKSIIIENQQVPF